MPTPRKISTAPMISPTPSRLVDPRVPAVGTAATPPGADAVGDGSSGAADASPGAPDGSGSAEPVGDGDAASPCSPTTARIATDCSSRRALRSYASACSVTSPGVALPAKPSRYRAVTVRPRHRSEEHTSELQSHVNLVCRL